MIKLIRNQSLLSGWGRNGPFKCAGIEITHTSQNTVMLTGWTSKDHPVNGFVEIDLEAARELGEALIELTSMLHLAPQGSQPEGGQQ